MKPRFAKLIMGDWVASARAEVIDYFGHVVGYATTSRGLDRILARTTGIASVWLSGDRQVLSPHEADRLTSSGEVRPI